MINDSIINRLLIIMLKLTLQNRQKLPVINFIRRFEQFLGFHFLVLVIVLKRSTNRSMNRVRMFKIKYIQLSECTTCVSIIKLRVINFVTASQLTWCCVYTSSIFVLIKMKLCIVWNRNRIPETSCLSSFLENVDLIEL